MTRWLDIPLGGYAGQPVPTWETIAERYGRCTGRVAFYVRARIQDRRTFERVVSESIERNIDLLVTEHDELEELRRLRSTADRLIGARLVVRPTSPDLRR